MIGTKNNTKVESPSKILLFHCHGGGFVAQSSKTQEGYLKDLAKHLDVPILFVDYTLAIEAPYPRAFGEVLYAYCWARKIFALLGVTGETIIGAGDSAGANLLLRTTLKCIHLNIPTAKGLFIAYVPTLVHCLIRMMCLKGENDLHQSLRVVEEYTYAIGMEFGICKCATVISEEDDVRITETMSSIVHHLDAEEMYTYLGVEEQRRSQES